MSNVKVREEQLTRNEVDKASGEIGQILEHSHVDPSMRLGIRLTMEDMILNVCEALGQETPYVLSKGTAFRREFIRFTYEGKAFDPRLKSEEPSENWSRRILSDMGLSPEWQYRNGVNILELKLKRKQSGTFRNVLLALALAIACGLLGNWIMPEAVREGACQLVLQPIQSIFMNLLKLFAGIMVLLTVSCGVFNMGGMSSFSTVGRQMFRRFIGFTFAIATLASIACLFLFPMSAGADNLAHTDMKGASAIVDLVIQIVPGDPVSPFQTGNTMQIVLLGVVVGVALLMMGERARHVRTFAEEANRLVTDILTAICKLLPLYLFLLLTEMIWSGAFYELRHIWKPFLTMVALDLMLLIGLMTYVSFKYRVTFFNIVRKLSPSFLTCLSAASSVPAFGQTTRDSKQKFGVDESFVRMALPIRSVLYMPGLAIELVVLMYSLSQVYNVQRTITWIAVGILISSILAMAVPPLPGAAAMVFGILFSQMGIPPSAMVFAISCDVVFDFLDTAIANSVGMMEFVLQADKLGMLDGDVLRGEQR